MYKLKYVVEWKRSYFLYNGYHWNYVLTCDIKKIEKILFLKGIKLGHLQEIEIDKDTFNILNDCFYLYV